MAKKIDRAEPKKECPSCGLGVSLEANICEFCGWDFEEEDEWILQIEKLERELMLEKQKFEPGTVNHMIESTLRNPVLDKVETAESLRHSEDEPVMAGDFLEGGRTATAQPAKVPPEPAPIQMEEPEVVTQPQQRTRKVRSVKAPSPAPVVEPEPVIDEEPIPVFEPETPAPVQRTVRKVRQVANTQKPVAPEEPPKKTRAIRRVKG